MFSFIPCPLLLLDLPLGGSSLSIFLNKYIQGGHDEKDALFGDFMKFEILGHRNCCKVLTVTDCCRPSLVFLWEDNSFKHLADLICFDSIPCTNYHDQKTCPDMVLNLQILIFYLLGSVLCPSHWPLN